MTLEDLIYMTKSPYQIGGKDRIWDQAFDLYNENHDFKIKPFCHSHYWAVRKFIFKRFDFDPNYYKPGHSGLSQAAKDEIRQILREEIKHE
jgi:hypothetical protein